MVAVGSDRERRSRGRVRVQDGDRLCTREVRQRRRRRLGRPQRSDELDRALLRWDVAVALAELPVRPRQAVVLRDWAGYPTAEVAAMLGTRESTVRVHLARGRERLRAALTVEEEHSHDG